MSEQMQAVRIHDYGGPEVLRLESAPRPQPEADDVLVRIHASGVNPVDWKIREGHMREALGHQLPLTLGWDFSGVVEAVGSAVTDLAPGDAVHARPDIHRQGTYAEYVIARASEVAAKPAILNHVEAAAVPLAGLTAWQALFEHGSLTTGNRVLIHGASGGVGHFAVQLAKAHGAYVYGTASGQHLNFMHEIGVDHPIDYKTQDFTQEVHDQLDLVLDTVGGSTRDQSLDLLKPEGRIVSTVATDTAAVAERRGLRGAWFLVQPSRAGLERIDELITQGDVKPRICRVFPLAEARAAQELSQHGHPAGKIVLQLSA